VIRIAAASTSVLVMLAVAAPLHAQGNGKGKGPNKGGPPSASVLPGPAAVSPAAVGTVPFAWIDDASVLPPGDAALSIAMMRWDGSGTSEIQVPIVGASMGLTDRVQLGASIPRVAGNDLAGTTGGLGTTYISAKVGVLDGERFGVKLAAAPTLEILGSDTLSSLAPGERRTQFGLPVSAEIDRGAARIFASGGFFSGGVWFAGGGVGAQATSRLSVSAAFSRAWSTDSTGTMIGDRREVSGGVGFALRPQFSIFGSVSRTIATSDQNGAGTIVSGGLIVLLARPASPNTPKRQ
jgi:hypothetical protein